MISAQQLETVFSSLQSLAGELGRQDIVRASQWLQEKNRRREWHVVVLGETSSGKSCLINSLIDHDLLPEQAEPTTGQVVFVKTDSSEDGAVRLSGIRPDGCSESLSEEDFRAVCTGDAPWLCLRAEIPKSTVLPPGMVLVDTPGFNSCIENHSRILTDYLPQADAILFLTNYRRGVTEQDRSFLELARKSLGEENLDRLFFAANFCTTFEPDPRTEKMRQQISNLLDRELHLHPIVAGQHRPRRLIGDSLWDEIGSAVGKMDLENETTANLVRLAQGFVAILGDSLKVFEQAAQAEIKDLERLEEYVVQLRSDHEEARRKIENCRRELLGMAKSAVKEGMTQISQKASEEIASANRFTDAVACGAYIRGHFIQNEIDGLILNIGRKIEKAFESLASELEEVADRAEKLSLEPVRVGAPGPGSALEKIRDQAVRNGTAKAAGWVLGRLGGAVGQQAGLLNLARMGVKRAGQLVGKKFGREVYVKIIPQVIRNLGIRATTAVNVFAYVITEVVAKIYHFTTWKNSLQAVVDRTLGSAITDEPALDQLKQQIPFFREKQEPLTARLERSLHDTISEALEETSGLVEKDFEARISNASGALENRQKNPNSACAKVKEIRSKLEAIAKMLLIEEDKENAA